MGIDWTYKEKQFEKNENNMLEIKKNFFEINKNVLYKHNENKISIISEYNLCDDKTNEIIDNL